MHEARVHIGHAYYRTLTRYKRSKHEAGVHKRPHKATQHVRSMRCGKNSMVGSWSKADGASQGPNNGSNTDMHTTPHSHAERTRAHNRQPKAMRHVSHVWCSTTTNMWPWSKLTSTCMVQYSARSTSPCQGCILLNAHPLQSRCI